VLVRLIHDTMHIIRVMPGTATDMPLYTETITAKGLNIMIMATVRVLLIFHIIIVTINTMPGLIGNMVVQDITTTEIMNIETAANIAITTIIVTIILPVETIIKRLPINKALTPRKNYQWL